MAVGVRQSDISLHDLDDRVSPSLSTMEPVLAASWRLGSVSELPAGSHTYTSTGWGPETVVGLAGSCLLWIYSCWQTQVTHPLLSALPVGIKKLQGVWSTIRFAESDEMIYPFHIRMSLSSFQKQTHSLQAIKLQIWFDFPVSFYAYCESQGLAKTKASWKRKFC